MGYFIICLFLGVPDDRADRSSEKLQSAICYAIDGDQVYKILLISCLSDETLIELAN